MPHAMYHTDPAHWTAAILCGGAGTRLRSVLPDRPKALAEVGGRPFLFWLLDQLAGAGLRRVVLCTGWQAGQIERAIGPTYAKLAVLYSREDQPLGTGGALRQALPILDTPMVLALNGDSYCRADLRRLAATQERRGGVGTLALAQVPDTARYGRVERDAAGRITRFVEKDAAGGPGWINAGIYALRRELIESIPIGRAVSLEHETFPAALAAGVWGLECGGDFIDIGTPESLEAAGRFFTAAAPAAAPRPAGRAGPRNRLAKPLPETWRRHLIASGVPKRKYIAICRCTLADGRVVDEVVIEDGWIVAIGREHVAGNLEQRIDFDPRTIAALEVIQTA